MSILDRLKTLAEISDLGTRAYALLVDKSREAAAKDAKIKQLEVQVSDLNTQITGLKSRLT